ncbi:hypothetical protein ACFY7N_07660 [Streptomyces albidoflavus]|uniref:hypothetical protein n=2 Tax=Streptomyces TaxID=1883 RepID=UPI002060871B|nr:MULTISPECIES: hypothetical protein [Streptomyces]BDH71666.1 hypothetical protein MTP06_51150 [Streptomyces sp. PLM4]
MLVWTEPMPSSGTGRVMVRVHTPIGSAAAVWRGEPHDVAGRHHIEWTVEDDIRWGLNARSAVLAEPGVREEAGRVVLRGRLQLTEGGTAVLELGDSLLLFDIGPPPPPEDTWVEISVEPDRVELHPYQL